MYSSEQLLSPDLDPDAYLRYALHSTSLTSEQTRLTGCLHQVKEAMQSILAENADGMVAQLQASHAAQREVSSARQSADSLTRAVDRLRLMIEEPYNAIQGKITELENTNEAVGILRDVLKFISLTARLQELMTPGSSSRAAAAPGTSADGGCTATAAAELDITRAARSLKELEDLCQVADIRGIEVVEAQMGLVEKASTTVRNRTHELLSVQDLLQQHPSGSRETAKHASAKPGAVPSALNKTVLDMGTALQGAYTLGNLTKVVHGFMMERKREVLKSVMRELDPQGIAEDASERASSGGDVGGAGSPTSGGARGILQSTQEALLLHIQSALYTVVQHAQCVILLWRVLLRRQDALSQTPLFRALDSPVQLLVDFWNAVMDKLRERLVVLQRRSDFEAALSAAYPQFRLLLESLLSSSGDLTGGAAAAAVAGAIGGGGSGSAAGGAGSFSSVTDSATSLLLFNMPQWGLGDYLDLLQVVDAAANPAARPDGAGGFSSSSSSASIEALKHTWVSLVADDLQKRFSAQLMDRHREKLSPILNRLSGITPASAAVGGQTISVSAAEARRGMLPAAANALDVASYTHLALQDCYAYRHDPLALGLSVECVLASTQQLLTRLREAAARFSLPPLPAVTTSVTRTQLMHICIANGCTVLVQDLSSILALLPEQTTNAGAGGGAAEAEEALGRSEHGSAAGLAEKRYRLRTTAEAFRSISECATLPFLSSARATLVPAVASCVDVAYNGSGGTRAILQLSTRLDVFLNNYYLLIDPRTSAWADATRRLADTLMARLLAQCVTVTLGKKGSATQAGVSPTAVNRALANCVQECLIVLLSFASATQATGSHSHSHTSSSSSSGNSSGGVGRSTLMLKGCAKQTELFYSTLGSTGSSSNAIGGGNQGRLAQELRVTLKPLYPLLAHFLLLQQGQLLCQHQQQIVPRSPVMDDTEKLTELVEQGLMRSSQTGPPPANAPTERDSYLPDAEFAQREAEVERAVGTCFQGLTGLLGTDGMGGILCEVWQSVPEAK